MSAMNQPDRLSIEDYLAGELVSETKLEYVAGAVYAMAGASNRHNAIVGNAFGQLFLGLRGKPCRPFNSDTKVRIDLGNGTRFFYPDAMVVCDRNPDEDSFQQQPVVILEVLSPTTRRLDLEEKYQAYLQIPSLRVLLFIEQDLPAVACHRRQSHGAFAQVPWAVAEGRRTILMDWRGIADSPDDGTTEAAIDAFRLDNVSCTTASWNPIGTGCTSGTSAPVLTALNLPSLGNTFITRVNGIGFGIPAMIVSTTPTLASLPFPEFATGCFLFVQPDVITVLTPSAGQAFYFLPIPNNLALDGVRVYQQTIEFGTPWTMSAAGYAEIH